MPQGKHGEDIIILCKLFSPTRIDMPREDTHMYVVVFVTQLVNQLPYSLVSLRMLSFDENEYPYAEQIIIFLYSCYALFQIFVLNKHTKRIFSNIFK